MKNQILTARIKTFIFLIILLNCTGAFCQQNNSRDVPYTQELYEFIDLFFNHKLLSRELLDKYFSAASSSIPEDSDDYSQLVHKGRCLYFYGLALMEDYDISDMAKVNLNDTSEKESKNKQAARYFDQTIELTKQALKIKKGSDAYSLLCNGISANCTAKNTAYIIGNGLKVGSYSKKAVAADYSNGTAHYLGNCQNIYAPSPFCNIEEGLKNMQKYLDNCYITNEKFDQFNILSAIAYGYQRLGKKQEAIDWYEKSLEIYPDNASVNRLLKKIKETNLNEKN